jgi:hypothetical protein
MWFSLASLVRQIFGEPETWAPVAPPDLAMARPPQLHPDGTCDCTGCNAVVPFAKMTIDERGYLCPGCARI